MTFKRMAALALVLTGLTACSEPPLLDAREVKVLFSGKTIEGDHEKKGFSFKSYYDPDGVFFSLRNGARPALLGRWWILDDGRICIRWETVDEDLCRHMVRGSDGRYTKVLVKSGKRIVIVRYRSYTTGKDADFL